MGFFQWYPLRRKSLALKLKNKSVTWFVGVLSMREPVLITYTEFKSLFLLDLGVKVVRPWPGILKFRVDKVRSLTGFYSYLQRSHHHYLRIRVIATRTWEEGLLFFVFL